MKSKIVKLLKDMIPVISGILIALFINNWNEQRAEKNYVDKIMYSIGEELKENKTGLLDIVKDHQQLLDTIQFYEDEEIAIGEFIGKVSGIGGVTIKNTAWKAMTYSRLDLLEYEKISILTDIDEQKGIMNAKFEKLTDLIYSKLGSTDYIDRELFRITVNDLLYAESTLLELHDKFMQLQ